MQQKPEWDGAQSSPYIFSTVCAKSNWVAFLTRDYILVLIRHLLKNTCFSQQDLCHEARPHYTQAFGILVIKEER